MDIVNYVLAKEYTDSVVTSLAEGIIPQIGENGHWWIGEVDTGISATAKTNVEVDGTLKVDAANKRIIVLKDGVETVVGEYTTGIELSNIEKLFEEE